MAKIKLSKGELKRQRDALKQYERYLPTLQLKKQQLQLEILHQLSRLDERSQRLETKKKSAETWSGLLSEPAIDLKPWLIPQKINSGNKNIAGVDIPVFEAVDFPVPQYDLFVMPLWVDAAIEHLRAMVSLQEEIKVIEKGIAILRHELRITTQRVNLFEKVKIPEAKEMIRVIKIYLGDQMTSNVGRSKIAKNKIEESVLEEVAV